MITKEQMMPLLLEAGPGFQPLWEEFCEEWRDDPDPPLYSALGELARYMLRLHAKAREPELRALFGVVERLHAEGDAWVSEAATIGLLEALQNNALHDNLSLGQFVRYLGPETTKMWNKLVAFWNG